MKLPAMTVLLLTLAANPNAVVANTVAADANNTTNILPKSEKVESTERLEPPAAVSAQNLSLFGVIFLGVLGLFWIRRHTSEL